MDLLATGTEPPTLIVTFLAYERTLMQILKNCRANVKKIIKC
jgi:hypothetical protein